MMPHHNVTAGVNMGHKCKVCEQKVHGALCANMIEVNNLPKHVCFKCMAPPPGHELTQLRIGLKRMKKILAGQSRKLGPPVELLLILSMMILRRTMNHQMKKRKKRMPVPF